MADDSGFGGAAGGLLSAPGDIFNTIYGISQLISGNKHQKNLLENRPQYNIDPNILYNQQLAGQTASEGLSTSAKNFYAENIDRGLGSSIQAGLASGQGLGVINQIYGQSNDAFRNLLAMDAQQKLDNQSALMGANKDLRDERLRSFDYNESQPWNLRYGQAVNQTNSGASNLTSGLKGLGSDALTLLLG
jgi:hypothetical protein